MVHSLMQQASGFKGQGFRGAERVPAPYAGACNFQIRLSGSFSGCLSDLYQFAGDVLSRNQGRGKKLETAVGSGLS